MIGPTTFVTTILLASIGSVVNIVLFFFILSAQLPERVSIIHIEKTKISEEDAFELAINAGAKDCSFINGNHEIITNKEDFYKVKTELEKNIDNFFYSGIEWRASSYQNLNKEQSKKVVEVLSSLEEIDDVQNVFTNANIEI